MSSFLRERDQFIFIANIFSGALSSLWCRTAPCGSPLFSSLYPFRHIASRNRTHFTIWPQICLPSPTGFFFTRPRKKHSILVSFWFLSLFFPPTCHQYLERPKVQDMFQHPHIFSRYLCVFGFSQNKQKSRQIAFIYLNQPILSPLSCTGMIVEFHNIFSRYLGARKVIAFKTPIGMLVFFYSH